MAICNICFSSREEEIIIAGRHVLEKIKKTWSWYLSKYILPIIQWNSSPLFKSDSALVRFPILWHYFCLNRAFFKSSLLSRCILTLSVDTLFKGAWLGGIGICWWILLRKSRETVVIAGPVFVHLLNLITFLVTFQLVLNLLIKSPLKCLLGEGWAPQEAPASATT